MSLESSVAIWDKITFGLAVTGALLVAASVLTSMRYRNLNRQLMKQRADDAQREKDATARSIAEADLRAAQANQKAEEERLARLRLEAALAPRNLNRDQQVALAASLNSLNVGQQSVDFFMFSNDPLDSRFSDQLISALGLANWKSREWSAQSGSGGFVIGVVVMAAAGANDKIRLAAKGLASAITEQHVAAAFDPVPFDMAIPPGTTVIGPPSTPGEGASIRVLIGKKL